VVSCCGDSLLSDTEDQKSISKRAERRASWITAISLFALACYIVADSAWTLLTRAHAGVSWWGMGLAIAAAIIMPLLWQGKLRVAQRIGSAALKADAACSATCAYMSLTLLAGLLLNHLFGWWWADPLAALVLVYFIVREGREAWISLALVSRVPAVRRRKTCEIVNSCKSKLDFG